MAHRLIYKKIVLIILILLTCFLLYPKKGISSAEKIPVPHLDSNASVVISISKPIVNQVVTSRQPIGNHIVQVDNMVCEQYRPLIEQYDWNVDIAMAIMKAESHCNATIVNDNPATKDFSIGLMQINIYGENAKYRPSEEALKDPATNIEFAYNLYKSSGFQSQWGVCRRSVNCI